MRFAVVSWVLVSAAHQAAAAVHVDTPSACLDPVATQQALETVLGTRPFDVTVATATIASGYAATLRLVNARGELVLERYFDMTTADCPSAGALLAAVLDAFLRAIPELAPPAPRVGPAVPQAVLQHTRDVTRLRLVLAAAVAGRGLPFGADTELALNAVAGAPAHSLVGSVVLRQSVPRAIAKGWFSESAVLLGLGWGHDGWLGADVRAGLVYVRGHGFDVNEAAWVPWLEGRVGLALQVGAALVGPELTASPMVHTLHAGNARQRLPIARLGLAVRLPVFEHVD